MIRRFGLLALLLWGGARAVHAQTPVVVRVDDAGRGVGPEILARALAQPHRTVPPGGGQFLLPRDSTFRQTVIVLGRDVVVEGKVQGDVIVVAGDLYMHPTGSISGRAISIGGGVYESMLATIGGGVTTFRDFTYDIQLVPGGVSLRYRSMATVPDEGGLSWPGIYGVVLPSYDRTNGLSLGGGPRYVIPGTRVALEPTVTYRSQLGKLDPFLTISDVVARGTTIRLRAGRSTLSNDRWIRPDLFNSAVYFYNGNDTRNYYRATGGDLTITHRWESVSGQFAPYGGVRYEDAASVRPGFLPTGGPWTIRGRNEREDVLRPNPPIDAGTTRSVIAGALWDWSDDRVVAHLDADAEVAGHYAQLTLGGHIAFPTFKTQTLQIGGHLVGTTRGRTPLQRYAYLGGAGTIPTLDFMSLGGDQLVFFDARYLIPIERVKLPLVGSPLLTLREILGGAEAGAFPTIHHAVGAGLGVSVFTADFLIDPDTHVTRISFGLSLVP